MQVPSSSPRVANSRGPWVCQRRMTGTTQAGPEARAVECRLRLCLTLPACPHRRVHAPTADMQRRATQHQEDNEALQRQVAEREAQACCDCAAPVFFTHQRASHAAFHARTPMVPPVWPSAAAARLSRACTARRRRVSSRSTALSASSASRRASSCRKSCEERRLCCSSRHPGSAPL